MSPITSAEIRLPRGPAAGRPRKPSRSRGGVAAASDGQVLVRNLFMSVDPYMRGRMNDVKSYVPPFQVGQPLEGGAIGEVVASRAEASRPDDVVLSMRGWRDLFVADARDLRASTKVQPLSLYLGALGMPGLTAWVGLKLVEIKAGDRVFVSAAAGAVGSVAGQLAKLRGCVRRRQRRLAEKVKLLTGELGFDAAFNYKEGDVRRQLAAAAPDGHRRVLRQRRGRSPRSRALVDARPRPHHRVRSHLALQRRSAIARPPATCS